MARRGKALKVEKKAVAAHPAAVKATTSAEDVPTKVKKSGVIFTRPQIKLQTAFFPKIYRFITERWKLFTVSLISSVILLGIVLQSIQLYRNLQEEKRIEQERGETEKELGFWRNSLATYKDSRDIYLRIASLEYRLGDKDKARESLKKALEIDPNFKEGREMEKQLEL